MDDRPAPFRPELRAPGTGHDRFERLVALHEVGPSTMRRVSRGDLDLLVARTPDGVVVVDDRCPHMGAPLSIGVLAGCVVACPLHNGTFDLASGDVVQMPTTGGLDPDGAYHPSWSPAGGAPKEDPPGKKAEARRLTRVRRFRYYPVRVVDGWVEAILPD